MSGTPDDTKPVHFTVKAPVYLQIGDAKADTAHSGVCVVDVNLPFGKPVNVSKRRERVPHMICYLQHPPCFLSDILLRLYQLLFVFPVSKQ